MFVPPKETAANNPPKGGKQLESPKKRQKGNNPQAPNATPKDPANVKAVVVGVPKDKQLCVNHFASLIGAGPDCDKKPGDKGYPCTRIHVTVPTGGSKWDKGVLDDGVDAAVRTGNAGLLAKVKAAVALLR